MIVKPTTEKPPLAPLESSKEEEEGLVSKREKKKNQMAQFAKVQALTDYRHLHNNLKNFSLTWFFAGCQHKTISTSSFEAINKKAIIKSAH